MFFFDRRGVWLLRTFLEIWGDHEGRGWYPLLNWIVIQPAGVLTTLNLQYKMHRDRLERFPRTFGEIFPSVVGVTDYELFSDFAPNVRGNTTVSKWAVSETTVSEWVRKRAFAKTKLLLPLNTAVFVLLWFEFHVIDLPLQCLFILLSHAIWLRKLLLPRDADWVIQENIKKTLHKLKFTIIVPSAVSIKLSAFQRTK